MEYNRKNVPWMGVHLLELNLVGGNGDAIFVKDQESGTGRTLVDGTNKHLFLLRISVD